MFERTARNEPTIGLTPLIDIIFILLIFVVLTANFERIQGLHVALPEAGKGEKTEAKSLYLTIKSNGDLFIQDRPIAKRELEATLRSLRTSHKHLVLRADHQVALQHAVYVLDQASQIGFVSVSIATKNSVRR